MPSPFPGMNPYLEQAYVWHDFHQRFIPTAAEVLGAQVQPRYFVRIDDHIYVHEQEEGPGRLVGRSDVSVTEGMPGAPAQAATELLEASAEVLLPVMDEERVSYLEVRDREDRQLITVVELLSPSNKSGKDRNQYLAKRDEILASPAHLVEIDLLRGGERMPLRKPVRGCDYCVLVSRAEDRPKAAFRSIQLRDRLPAVPVPLRAGEASARLDLQEVLHRIYDAAGYAYYIYSSEPEPPLSDADAEWARQFVPQRP